MLNERGTSFCRACTTKLSLLPILSLGNQPLSNALTSLENEVTSPSLFPLDFRICNTCGLGQIGEFVSPKDIFEDYTYFSSASSFWLAHSERYATEVISKYKLNKSNLVLEIASNDGYLLRKFADRGLPVLGIEPAKNVARFAESIGVPTLTKFFGEETAKSVIESGFKPSLVIANNVLAHVPDINDFMAGLECFAKNGARISIEAPSMMTMLTQNLFDTIYHEHFSYLSVSSVSKLADKFNLNLYHVEYLNTHGGSYRYWISSDFSNENKSVDEWARKEKESGIFESLEQNNFANNSLNAIIAFKSWVESNSGKILGYGAAAKATVLLNAAGISNDQITAIIDNGQGKQYKRIPGVNVPIFPPQDVSFNDFEKLVVFPWNIADEIVGSVSKINSNVEIWVALPELRKLR